LIYFITGLKSPPGYEGGCRVQTAIKILNEISKSGKTENKRVTGALDIPLSSVGKGNDSNGLMRWICEF
jgi:hypothetical protein